MGLLIIYLPFSQLASLTRGVWDIFFAAMGASDWLIVRVVKRGAQE